MFYNFISQNFKKSGVVSGFDSVELASSIFEIILLIKNCKYEIKNNYSKIVRNSGNVKAREMLNRVFEKNAADWRGFGIIPESGLKIKEEFKIFDAENFIQFSDGDGNTHNNACICGEILKGKKKPNQCSLFKKKCSPDNPYGACMVSSEGACGAYYKYGQLESY